MATVKTSFAAFGRVYPAGSTVDDTDRAVTRFPAMFDVDVKSTPAPVVEQATAEPGEVRPVKKRATRKSAAKPKG